MRSFLPLTVLCAVVLGGAACGDADVEFTEPVAMATPPTDFTFRTGVIPLLDEQEDMQCTHCHDGNTKSSGLDMDGLGEADTIHANLLDGGAQQTVGAGLDVNLEVPEDSLLLVAPLPGEYTSHPHKPFEGTDDPRYLTILGWIQAGAPND